MLTFNEILNEAARAAENAAREKQIEFFGGDSPNHDGYPCGFAWVHVTNGRDPFVKWCKAQEKISESRRNPYGSKHWKKGWEFWNPSRNCCQNVDVKEAGADAFAEVLRENGIECYASSRLD